MSKNGNSEDHLKFSTSNIKYSNTYRRLIKNHLETSKNIQKPWITPIKLDFDTTELEYDSSSDINPSTVSLTSEISRIRNRIMDEKDQEIVKEKIWIFNKTKLKN